MPTTHGKQHPLSTAEDFLEAIKIFWKIAHPWQDPNPRPPHYMLSIHMYKCIHMYIFVGNVTQLHTFFANVHIKLDRHSKQTPKSKILWEMIYVINRPQYERIPLISQLASLFYLDSAYIKTPIYQILYFPPGVKIPAIFVTISGNP